MSAAVGVGELVDGKYRILRLIGEGGWGIVFEAENTRTLKRVALKVLRSQASITADIQARFEREAQAAGRIGSEHIVEVFDLGTLPDGTSYMVMELLSGEELSARVEKAGKLEPIVAVKLVVQLLDGLGAAHAAGILHRDLKPENLFLVPTRTGEDFVKILDFGISKFANTPAISATMTGAVLGSPFYMAPEQARGLKQIDARTDLYAVGTVLFECITGRVPFEGDNFNDLMFRIVLAPRPNPSDFVPDLEPDLVGIMTKAISAEPSDRYQTAASFREALVTWLDANGVASVRAPELRRAFNMSQTPQARLSDGSLKMTPSKRREEPSWSDATVAMPGSVTGKDTPVASSSTLQTPARARRRTMLVAVGAVTALGVIGGVSMRPHAHEKLTAETAVLSSPSSPSALANPAPPSTTPPVQPIVPAAALAAPLAVGPADASAADLEDSTNTAQGAQHGRSSPTRSGHGARAKDAGTPAVVPVAEAPKTPAPPAAFQAPPKPADTVEGREIRTNL